MRSCEKYRAVINEGRLLGPLIFRTGEVHIRYGSEVTMVGA
jgi:hypothetical protein